LLSFIFDALFGSLSNVVQKIPSSKNPKFKKSQVQKIPSSKNPKLKKSQVQKIPSSKNFMTKNFITRNSRKNCIMKFFYHDSLILSYPSIDLCGSKKLPCKFFVSHLHDYRFVWIQKVARGGGAQCPVMAEN
jgi:hypothetical protein